MREIGRNPAKQIEEQEAERAHAILDVVAKNPKCPHVPDQVYPTPVQEHASQKWPIIINWKPEPNRPIRMSVARWHKSEQVEEVLESGLRNGEFKQENQTIDSNQSPGHDCRISPWNCISNWKHRVAAADTLTTRFSTGRLSHLYSHRRGRRFSFAAKQLIPGAGHREHGSKSNHR